MNSAAISPRRGNVHELERSNLEPDLNGSAAVVDFYEKYVPRCSSNFAEYRIQWIFDRLPEATRNLVDIGCGMGRNLQVFAKKLPGATLCGIDVAANAVDNVRSLGYEGVCCDASSGTILADHSIDVVVCGEVIEHVIDTDQLLLEIRRVLRKDGILFLTTPNLAYAVNRLLLLFGIQPIFTETSLHKNLGRRLRILGQGNPTQGHLKIFTKKALEELLDMHGFQVVEFAGYNMLTTGISGWVDRILRRFPSFAAGFLVAAKPRSKSE